ncbi:MAG: type II toxin-antitoxin system HipA family toxin YjjJ [Elusimicrobia bacterium]|nr:type II toxin-antitoxin system HipA family toxin YjjJ [Elusimicrobiota bacterium]
MPKKPSLDHAHLAANIRARLLAGPSSAAVIFNQLGISQPTFSRAVRKLKAELLIAGRASKTRYALRRMIDGAGARIPVFQIDENGGAARFGELHSIHSRGFFFQPTDRRGETGRFFPDLPYFIDDLRPSGFLGRLIPRRHPELEAPRDISAWTSDHCLRYLTRFGADLIGDLILGDAAFRLYLDEARQEPRETAKEARELEYPRRAREVLELGDPGSSAGGEQPKFSAVSGPGARPVLVKFSPKIANDVARRRADLLACEHLALETIRRAGLSAARSELLLGGDQAFLEVERFDRVPPRGRRGLISLAAFDAEHLGLGRDWSAAAARLLENGLISREVHDEIRWRELFGHLIANTDMHQSNLSFYFTEPSILGLAPAYDMLPMLYAPQNEQLVERAFKPGSPGPEDAPFWESVCAAAAAFWAAVAADSRVSPGFRAVAHENGEQVASLRRLGELLP